MDKPYTNIEESDKKIIRGFLETTDSDELIWHQDKEDRLVKSIGNTDWLIQLDNKLPRSLNEITFIPKGMFHRVIKGTGNLTVEIRKIMKLSELKNIIREVAYPKNKYIQVTDKSELKTLQDQIFDLIQNAYSSIGGHVKFKSPSDVLDPELTYWKVADVDDDPEIDVTTFGKNTSKGVKHTGLGHDGERANIKNLLKYKTSLLKSPGNYVEVSGAAFDSFVGKGGAPTIDDEATVRDILKGKELEWHGKHPTDPSRKGEGWYTRVIGGKKLTKILAGIPG